MNRNRYSYNLTYDLNDCDLRKSYEFHPEILKFCNLDLSKKYKFKVVYNIIKPKLNKTKIHSNNFYNITKELKKVLIKIDSNLNGLSILTNYYEYNIKRFIFNCVINYIPDNIFTLEQNFKGNDVLELTI